MPAALDDGVEVRVDKKVFRNEGLACGRLHHIGAKVRQLLVSLLARAVSV